MADEPRRSGRATKGQHTKSFEDNDAPNPAPRQKKSKGNKKNATMPDEEDDEEEDALIRCICGVQDDEGGRMMICCDHCTAWQHNDCMGVTEVEDQIPDSYACEECVPSEHDEYWAMRKSGLGPEQAAEKRRQESAKSRRGRKPGKKSKGARASKGEAGDEVAASSPTQVLAPEQSKRKMGKDTDLGSDEQPTKIRKSVGQDPKSATPVNTEPKNVVSNNTTLDLVQDISELKPNARKNVAAGLKKQFVKAISDISSPSKRLYRIPDGETADSLGNHYGIHVEHCLFLNYCGMPPNMGGAYSDHSKMIHFNISKNPELLLKVLNDVITPDHLSKMDSADMATEEQKQKDAMIQEQNRKQSMAVQDEQKRIRRTHKGEELVDDQYEQFGHETMTNAAPRYSLQQDETPLRSSSATQSAHRGSDAQSHPPMYNADQGGPTVLSPIAPSSDVVWRGHMEVHDTAVTSFDISAHHVAGAELGSPSTQSALFPNVLTMGGRIVPERADNYLTSLSAARATDVVVYKLVPSEASDSFEWLWDYLKYQKNRYGVVTNVKEEKGVRDLYLVPLSGGAADGPAFLRQLERNTLDMSRHEHILLAVLVVKHAIPDAPPISATTPRAPAFSSQDAIPIPPTSS